MRGSEILAGSAAGILGVGIAAAAIMLLAGCDEPPDPTNKVWMETAHRLGKACIRNGGNIVDCQAMCGIEYNGANETGRRAAAIADQKRRWCENAVSEAFKAQLGVISTDYKP